MLTTLTVTMNGPSSPTTSVEPFTPANLGEIKATGKAKRYPDIADWLESVALVHGLSLSGAGLQSAAAIKDESGKTGWIMYNGSGVITGAALSHRYDRKAG